MDASACGGGGQRGPPSAVVTALLAAGANPAARDADGCIPWDLIEDDSPLKGSDVYRQLKDARFQRRR